MDFIGREQERALLDAQYAGETGAFVAIYGRRRVGKTALLRAFCSGLPAVFHVGKEAPDQLQRKAFLVQAARTLEEPQLAEMAPPEWKPLLSMVRQRWRGARRLVLVLDEVQWTRCPELLAALRELWDSHWQSDRQLMLVLCGAPARLVKREVLGAESPLFQLPTAQLHLRPFGFREARAFHAPYCLTDAARVYFICGGVPAYLRAFRADRSVEQNIRDNLLDELAPLYREAAFMLHEELREVQNYHAILEALARGSLPQKELGERTSIPVGSVPYYLSQLESLGYVRRRYPLSDRRPVARVVRPELAEPLLRFWFRFVFPNLSELAATGAARTFQRCIEPHLPAYCGDRFEALCREALPMLYEVEGVTAGFEVGEYWGKEGKEGPEVQIDVVGRREDNFTDLGECAWASVSPAAAAGALEAKVGRFPNERNATIGRRIFSRDALEGELPGFRWHSLAEIYGQGS